MNHPPDNEKADAGLHPDAGSENQLGAGLAHNAIASMADAVDNPQLIMDFIEHDDLTARFERFHADNPKVYETLVSLARTWVRNTGRRKIGIKALFERARWEIALSTVGEDFKMNNNYAPYYSRLIMRQEEDLADLFELRRSAADAA